MAETEAERAAAAAATMLLTLLESIRDLARAQNAEMDRQGEIIDRLISLIELQTRRIDALQTIVAGLQAETEDAAPPTRMH